MSDYTANIHNFNLNVSFIPSSRVILTAFANYNLSKGELEQVEMPSVEERLDGHLSHQDFTFLEMHTYSDLDYKWLRLNLGIEYLLSPRVTLTADAEYSDLTDDSGGWVYGDETGSLLIVRGGVRIEF